MPWCSGLPRSLPHQSGGRKVSLKLAIGETSFRYAQKQRTVVVLLEILIVGRRKVVLVLVLCWQTYGKLKTLGDKSREAKKSRQRTVQCLPEFSAGLELLSRYEDAWAALHKGAKDCAKAGELVDSEVVMLSAHWEKKRNSLVELQDQLQQIPGFLADLECLTASLAQLEANFEEMENHLLCLEDLCEQCELERYKCMQTLQLENYKKTKRYMGNMQWRSLQLVLDKARMFNDVAVLEVVLLRDENLVILDVLYRLRQDLTKTPKYDNDSLENGKI
nr:PREDICTED: dysbindin-like [Pelecanus crispus]